MKKLIKHIIITISSICCFSITLFAAEQDTIINRFVEFNGLYYKGDFNRAEKIMLGILDKGAGLPAGYLLAAYNNLGLIKKSFGLYNDALGYYDKAEALVSGRKEYLIDLAYIYNNISRIYTFRRSFPTAIEFLEKSVRIFQSLDMNNRSVLQSLSTAYLNLGINYYESGGYQTALDYLEKSSGLKSGYDLTEKELVFLNLAKTYARLDDPDKSEVYFEKCLATIFKKFGHDYYRLIDVYFGYSEFLAKTGKYDEALKADNNALDLCLRNYGKKHPLVSMAYEHLGDFYTGRSDYLAGLEYYQRSLIAAESGFNDTNIFSNPLRDSTLFNIRLLDILKKKTRALELYSEINDDTEKKLEILRSGLSANDLALQLIESLRNTYLTEDSRIYLAENEKETYLSGIRLAGLLYKITGESSFKVKMYSIEQRSKSAVLKNEITANESFIRSGIPDSLWKRQNDLAVRIAAYNNLLTAKTGETPYDSIRVVRWKDDLFSMNREMEKLHDEINLEYPQYNLLIQKTGTVPVEDIQKHLKRNETIIDFLLSNHYSNGKRSLYTFIITKRGIDYLETGLDSAFMVNASFIREAFSNPESRPYEELTDALHYMYQVLIRPVEDRFTGNKLIIIPDEEITWVPFDALITNKPGPGHSDFEGLEYIVRKYSVSCSFSSSLIFNNNYRIRRKEGVISFAPYYGIKDSNGDIREKLPGTADEIRSIYRYFGGRAFEGQDASESNFRREERIQAIFHLAMHSVTDSSDSRYSYLVFDRTNDTIEDGRLYNYEISLSRIRSPMVVLSACNSGTGTLYHGEGLMSLARAFRLAGVSSVVRTSWEVNDETSAEIISGFYKYLSKSKYKDDALRLAKLDYLKSSPPAYSDPYYWAAYEVYGNNAPLIRSFPIPLWIIIAAGLIIAVVPVIYLRRRRMLADRSL